MYRLVLVTLMLVVTSSAHATVDSGSRSTAEKTVVDVMASFADQFKAIEADLTDGKTYSEISPKDREAVRNALQRISIALSRAGNVQNLSASEKALVFNDQELANNILTRASEDSLVVCRREKKVGSHRATTQCATVAERRRAAEESQKALRDNQRIQMPAAG